MPVFRLISLVWVLGWVSALAAPKESGPRAGRWAHEDFAQTPDSRVVWGRLENG
jgi:hypothetical protein